MGPCGFMRLYEISGEAAQAVRCAVTSPEGTGTYTAYKARRRSGFVSVEMHLRKPQLLFLKEIQRQGPARATADYR